MSISKDVEDRLEGADGEADQDARLVAQVLSGAGDAFDVLVRRYQRRALAVAYRLLSNVDDAADVAQEALLRAYRNLDQLTDHRRFGPWLMRIVTNLSLNYRRARKASSAVEFNDEVEAAASLRVSEGPTRRSTLGPSGEAGAAELRAAARAAIDALPEKQRVALVLSSIEGVPQKEIAEILDCSVELVKWNVFQARKTLKQALAGYLPSDRD